MSFPSKHHCPCKGGTLFPLSSSSANSTNPNTILFFHIMLFVRTSLTQKILLYAAQLGFEPRLGDSESPVLPIGRPGNKMFLSIVLLLYMQFFLHVYNLDDSLSNDHNSDDLLPDKQIFCKSRRNTPQNQGKLLLSCFESSSLCAGESFRHQAVFSTSV